MEPLFKIGDKVKLVEQVPPNFYHIYPKSDFEVVLRTWQGFEYMEIISSEADTFGEYLYKVRETIYGSLLNLHYRESWLIPYSKSPDSVLCNCDIQILMTAGCRCGAFKREQEAKKAR